MTQSPIEPRHKDEAKRIWEYNGMTVEGAQNKIAQTLANDEAKGTALAEIWKLSCETALSDHDAVVVFAKAACNIAAPYRASDPVAEALKAEAMTIVLAESVPRTIQQIEAIRNGIAGQGKIDLVMRALKRGMELARTEGDR